MAASSHGMQGQYAGFISRAIGLVVDNLIIVAIVAVVNGVIALALSLFLGLDVSNCPAFDQTDLISGWLVCNTANWIRLYFSLAVTPVYFALFWTLGGQTLGQYAMGLRVVRLDGRRMTVVRSLVRWAGYLLSFLTLGLGFIWVLWDDRRQGWPDKMARTVVVYAWEARQNEFMLDRLRSRWRARRNKVLPSAAAPASDGRSLRLELVLTVMPTMSRVNSTMNVLQDALRQQAIEIVTTLVFVKDETGVFGYVGSSDLAAGDNSAHGDALVASDPRFQQIRPEVLAADVPNGSFVLLIVTEDKQLAPLLKTLTSARIAAQVFDLDTPAHPPVTLTPETTGQLEAISLAGAVDANRSARRTASLAEYLTEAGPPKAG